MVVADDEVHAEAFGLGNLFHRLDAAVEHDDEALTGRDDGEIAECLTRLMRTDAGTMFMHEAYHKDDDRKFTRHWFAWANTLFGELILHLLDEGKDDLINSLPEK